MKLPKYSKSFSFHEKSLLYTRISFHNLTHPLQKPLDQKTSLYLAYIQYTCTIRHVLEHYRMSLNAPRYFLKTHFIALQHRAVVYCPSFTYIACPICYDWDKVTQLLSGSLFESQDFSFSSTNSLTTCINFAGPIICSVVCCTTNKHFFGMPSGSLDDAQFRSGDKIVISLNRNMNSLRNASHFAVCWTALSYVDQK